MARSDLQRKLFNPNYDNYNLLGQLKGESEDLKEFDKKIRQALKHPFTKHVLEANPFPFEYSKINKVRQVNYTNNLAGEIGWYLTSLEKHSNKISNFLALRKDFDNNLLKGELERCIEILNEVDSEISISIWSIENRLIIKELGEGSEANWEFLSSVTSDINNALVLFIAECLSKRSEKSISFVRYNDFLNSKIENLGLQPLVEYFNFRLNYNPSTGYSFFPFFLSIESSFPLIDRYLILENIVTEKISHSVLEEQEIRILKNTIDRLQKISFNKSFSNCLAVLDGTFIKSETSSDILTLIDAYSKGEFESCLSLTQELVEKHYASVEIYELYIKSLIQLEKNYVPLTKSNTINQITEKLYNIFSWKGSYNEDLVSLLKISSTFINTHWGKQLIGLTYSLTNYSESNMYSFQYLINSKFNNPRILSLIKASKSKEKYISEFKKEFGPRISLSINDWIISGDSHSIEKSPEINNKRKLLYQAKALNEAENYQKIIDLLGNSDFNSDSNFLQEEIVNLLYYAYSKTDNVTKALKLFVNSFLKNNYLTSRLSEEILLKKIDSLGIDSIEQSIDLPIFYKIASTDTYPQYVAYDAFLTNANVDRPSEIKIRDIPKNKLIYFLDNVCSNEVMQFSLTFEGFEEVDSERQEILRILLKIDGNNEDKYIKEIAELTQGSNVRKAIQEVNKGRITVNIPQLKNIESSRLEEGFQRYKKLNKFSQENKNAKGIDVSATTLSDYFETLLEDSEQDVTNAYNDPAYISFKTIFLDIRDKFLLSKEYGLDGYLSTRIRHGTLENHIRSVFEKYHLLAEKNSQNEYQDINFWDEKTPQPLQPIKSSIQEKLKNFSKKIDDQINFITHELIQVYTEKYNKKPKALFNYNFTHEVIWLLYKHSLEIESHEKFVEYIFSNLRTWTEERLILIRSTFTETIKEQFISELNQLQHEVDEITGHQSFTELNASILNSRTDINNEIDRISEWFYLSNPSSNMESDIMTTLRTSVEITNSIYPNHQIEPNYIKQVDIPLIGAVHVIYISRILLDNIIKHSGIEDEKIPVDISTEIIDSEVLRLGFKHNLIRSPEDLKTLKNTLSKVKQKWRKKSDFEKSNIEGGSGFEKIRRILAFDLKGKNYGFEYDISKDTLEIFVDIDVKIREQINE